MRTFDYLRASRWWLALSMTLLLAGMVSLWKRGGPRYGIEFTGGALMHVQLDETPDMGKLREELTRSVPGAILGAGEDHGRHSLWITVPAAPGQDLHDVRGTLIGILDGLHTRYDIRSFDAIGAQMGSELRQQAILATALASAGMLAYVAWRFELRYATAAVAAVVHDTLVTLGLFSLAHWEVNLNVVAALLTLVGYSMNDTIVVFDRVRENRAAAPGAPFRETINTSIQQTLRRTLLTSGLTMLAALALLCVGGPVLRGFSLAITLGIVVGTYSSIFIASPILDWWTRLATGRKLA